MASFKRSRCGRIFRSTSAICVVSVVLSLATGASAQTASDKAAAEAFFDEGVQLLKAGNFEEACHKLERSQAVDPGIGTLLYLGECYKQAGRTASAWATFREAASKAEALGEEDRAQAGTRKADELEPKLSRVLFAMNAANREIEGLEVLHGESDLNRALWGSAVPVDPGPLTVKASAPGYEDFQITVEINPGPSEQTVKIAALTKLPEVPQAIAASAESKKESRLETATPQESAPPSSAQRTVGLVLGGTGLVGLGVGGVFGTLAYLNEQDAQKLCTGSTCPPDGDGLDHSNKAQDYALVSTISFIAGGALLATGVILYYTAPSSVQTANIQVTPTLGGAHLSMGSTF
jgi:tetratricopeptide (TPR) repeat protein